ncbi:MAG TPA: integrin alpha, partial [Bacteroidota bacterium]
MIRDSSLSLALLLLFATNANAQSPKQFGESPALKGGHKGGGSVPNAILERFFTGAAAGDVFGFSVASAGDVNGDGYSDIIIGAYLNDAGGTDAGRAYIYFGGAIINNVADVILTGHAATDVFGYSVAGAGDVNGDGYSDVIVGAYGSDSGAFNAGRAYLFLGGSSMNNVADVTFTGVAANDNLGFSVAGAGDVNGDGYSDVIVAAHRNDAGGVDAGRAYVYFGGSSMDNTVDVTLTGAAAGDQFGVSVASAGDVNGDGFADVIVGGFLNDTGGADAGRAYIFHGGGSMDNIADVTLTGAAAGDFFGFSVASARDVNGDGYSDVIVGAYLNDAGGADAGQAYLYLGGPSMDNTADATFTGAAAGDFFGVSVASAGDVNGDGYPDIIVGAQWNDAGGADAGRAYMYLGGPQLDNIVDAIFTGTGISNRFGRSVASAGDVNNDGYGDIIVGAYLNDDGGADAGKAYLYLNSLTGADIPDEFFTGVAA